MFRSWSRFLAVSLQVTWVINPAVGCHYFPPGPQLPLQPLRRLQPVSLLGEQRHVISPYCITSPPPGSILLTTWLMAVYKCNGWCLTKPRFMSSTCSQKILVINWHDYLASVSVTLETVTVENCHRTRFSFHLFGSDWGDGIVTVDRPTSGSRRRSSCTAWCAPSPVCCTRFCPKHSAAFCRILSCKPSASEELQTPATTGLCWVSRVGYPPHCCCMSAGARCTAPAAVDRYLLPARRSAANPPHASAVVDGRTDRRTCERFIDPLSTLCDRGQ